MQRHNVVINKIPCSRGIVNEAWLLKAIRSCPDGILKSARQLGRARIWCRGITV